MRWRECGGPQASPPKSRGFGLTLVERETRQGLGGRAEIDFKSTGLQVDLTFPAT